MWKVNDIVLCIDDRLVYHGSIKAGKTYTILGVKDCKCGIPSINVSTDGKTSCSSCNTEHEPALWSKRRFIKIGGPSVKVEKQIEEKA